MKEMHKHIGLSGNMRTEQLAVMLNPQRSAAAFQAAQSAQSDYATGTCEGKFTNHKSIYVS